MKELPPARQRLGVRQSSAALRIRRAGESGRGLPHSKTWRNIWSVHRITTQFLSAGLILLQPGSDFLTDVSRRRCSARPLVVSRVRNDRPTEIPLHAAL